MIPKRMIKDFGNYKILEEYSGGISQWQKTYEDGQFARTVIKNSGITRQKVIDAFNEMEDLEQEIQF